MTSSSITATRRASGTVRTPYSRRPSILRPVLWWRVTPFRVLPVEYPAPALTVFSLPLLMPWLSYDTAYLVWMALLLTLVTGAIAWRGYRQVAVAVPLYVLLAGWSFALQRYDLVVGICILATVMFAGRGRLLISAVFLAIATALKGLPVVLLPALLWADQLWRGRAGDSKLWRHLSRSVWHASPYCFRPGCSTHPPCGSRSCSSYSVHCRLNR